MKFALAAPAGTVTDDGTVSRPELLDSVTEMPPLPAVFDKVTVQVVLAPEPILEGEQERELTTVGAISETAVVCELPL